VLYKYLFIIIIIIIIIILILENTIVSQNRSNFSTIFRTLTGIKNRIWQIKKFFWNKQSPKHEDFLAEVRCTLIVIFTTTSLHETWEQFASLFTFRILPGNHIYIHCWPIDIQDPKPRLFSLLLTSPAFSFICLESGGKSMLFGTWYHKHVFCNCKSCIKSAEVMKLSKKKCQLLCK